MVSSIFNICSCFLYFIELTWLQNKSENNPLHCCLDWYWCILLGYTRCCDVFFMVSNARGIGTWTNIKFPPTRDLICVKCPGVSRRGWALLDLTHTLTSSWCLIRADPLPTPTLKVNLLNAGKMDSWPDNCLQWPSLKMAFWTFEQPIEMHRHRQTRIY